LLVKSGRVWVSSVGEVQEGQKLMLLDMPWYRCKKCDDAFELGFNPPNHTKQESAVAGEENRRRIEGKSKEQPHPKPGVGGVGPFSSNLKPLGLLLLALPRLALKDSSEGKEGLRKITPKSLIL